VKSMYKTIQTKLYTPALANIQGLLENSPQILILEASRSLQRSLRSLISIFILDTWRTTTLTALWYGERMSFPATVESVFLEPCPVHLESESGKEDTVETKIQDL
jgi:hypothetical protein